MSLKLISTNWKFAIIRIEFELLNIIFDLNLFNFLPLKALNELLCRGITKKINYL